MAAQYTIDTMTVVPDYDANFYLKHSQNQSFYFNLDCQSYFNKIDLYNSAGDLVIENYISTGECYYLWENINECIAKEGGKCLDTEDVFNPSCQCH